jgi:hypothetical protein
MKSKLKWWSERWAVVTAASSLVLTAGAGTVLTYDEEAPSPHIEDSTLTREETARMVESTPERILSDLEIAGVTVDKKPRIVPEGEFGNYQIVVDIFRGSKKRSVLGQYFPEYHDAATSTFAEADPVKREKLAQKRYGRLAELEFAVVSVDGIPQRAYLISGALETTFKEPVKKLIDGKLVPVVVDGQAVMKESKKSTPANNYRLTPVEAWGKTPDGVSKKLPFPFVTSTTYESSMWYALQVTDNGIFLHATPHYYQLGRRASMGCIRESLPDAMWLWNLVVNESGGRQAMIRIHRRDSPYAIQRLRELIYDPNYIAPNLVQPYVHTTPDEPLSTPPPLATASAPRNMVWLVDQLNLSHQRIQDFIAKIKHGDYDGKAHNWWNPRTKSYEEVAVPLCSGGDCEKVFNVDPIEKLRKQIAANYAARLEFRRKQLENGESIPRADSIALGYEVKPLLKKEPPAAQH